MKFDVILEPNAPAAEFARLGRLAEDHGFQAVWTANHLAARDPFLCFSQLAAEPGDIRMGPVAISPFELHPVKMANQILALNELSGGRANIVVGGGGGTVIAMGLKPDRRTMHPRMVRGVRECVDMLRRAGTGELVNYKGEIFQVETYRAGWTVQPPPRIYVAASKPQMLAMAARVADGVMFSDIPLGRMPETMEILRRGLSENDRLLETFPINNLYTWHVKPDREEAIQEARRKLWVRGMLENWYLSCFLSAEDCQLVEDNMASVIKAYVTDSPVIENIPESIIDAMVDQLTFTGAVSEVDKLVERIKEFEDAGVTEMGLRLYDDPEDSIRLLGERVLPAFG